MEKLLYRLTQLLQTKDEFVGCMKLLHKIVHNLVLHPAEDKYRKLNLENAKLKAKLFRFEPAVDLLKLIGFEQAPQSSHLVMQASSENNVVSQALMVKIKNCQPPKAAVPVVEVSAMVLLSLKTCK